MATQLALQRNFVTITPTNTIQTSSVQSTQTTNMTSSPTSNGDIVTITTTGNPSPSDANGTPIHVMQPVQQVNAISTLSVWKNFTKMALNSFPEEIHLANQHHIRWSVNNRRSSDRSIRFNGRCTHHSLHYSTSQFECIIAKSTEFTANHRSSCIRSGTRLNRVGRF